MNKIETPEEQDTRSRTTADKIRKENPTFLISSLLILTLIGIFVFVMYSYKDQKERLTENVQNNISTITDLKALQIEGWRKEHLDNGLMISADKLISDKVRSYHGKKNEEYEKDISGWLKTITRNTNYKTAYILDVSGNSILSEPTNTGRPGEQLLKYINKAIEEKKTILSDFHFYGNSDTAQLALVIPLVTSKDDDVGEVLLLEIDPNTVFYPMIKTWSPGSNTAECLLVKKDGEDILYLNKPSNSEYSASRFKVNLKEEELLSVKAFKGITGITTGIDYKSQICNRSN